MTYKVITVGDNSETVFSRMSVIPFNSELSEVRRDSLILFPHEGMTIYLYFPDNGELRTYDITCAGFYCSEQDADDVHDNLMPFSSAIMKDNYLYLAPYRGNMFVALNTISGESHEWKSSISLDWQPHDRYFTGWYKGEFITYKDSVFWLSATQKRLYKLKVSKNKCEIIKEIKVKFDVDEIREHAHGFCQSSPWWTQYGLQEDVINSLDSFLSGKVYGAPFDKQKELDSFKNVAVNLDGTCGQHVCDFLMKKMEL